MELKFKSILAPLLRCKCGTFRILHTLSKNKIVFPDPPCTPIDPHCFFIKETCRSALESAAVQNTFEKHLVQQQKQEVNEDLKLMPCPPCLPHRDPCELPIRKKYKKAKKPFRSMWTPHCEPHEQKFCKGLIPRFDEMYYTPSNKYKCFQRTWVECPRVRQRLKKVCCLDGIQPPEVERRVKEHCPKVSCTFDYSRMRHICEKVEAKIDPEQKCKKHFWPCCKPAQCNPSCPHHRRLNSCKRLRTPYRCFSDTQRYMKLRCPRECKGCLPSICDAMTYAKLKPQKVAADRCRAQGDE